MWLSLDFHDALNKRTFQSRGFLKAFCPEGASLA